MMLEESAVVVRNLIVKYGDRTVLDGINFDLRRGEVLVLLGESGSGKSTLLRQLIGLEKPLSGSILINGCDIVRCSDKKLNRVRQSIGVSFQNAALFGSGTPGTPLKFATPA